MPSTSLDDPAETVQVGAFVFRVIAKESLLADRVIGFKHWGHTSYGQQAIDMLAAFGEDLKLDPLMDHLRREGAVDAFEALRALAGSDAAVSESSLNNLLDGLDS